MKHRRAEFPKSVKVAAFEREKGHCQNCTLEITGSLRPVQYDHRKPSALGGDNSLENCQVLCKPCHDLKSFKPIDGDIPRIAKAQRGYEKRINARKKRSTFRQIPPGYKYDWSLQRVVPIREREDQ